MSKMSPSDLEALLAAAKADALAASNAARLSAERTDAMNYYLGDMSKDIPAADGRSQAVSTDVADTIEGLMPSLMEIFASSDEVVRFEPVGAEDVAAAEQETDYVNHVFMQKNPGFLILYSFIKDALLSKVGIVKVWWEEKELEERETYLDQSEETFAVLVADPEVEVVEHTAHGDYPAPAANGAPGTVSRKAVSYTDKGRDDEHCAICAHYRGGGSCEIVAGQVSPKGWCERFEAGPGPMLHDVTVVTRSTYQCARVEGVPPEEFGIARNARCIRDADYCFHEVLKSEHALIGQGFDAAQIRKLPSYTALQSSESQARDTVDEHAGGEGDDGINRANRLIKVTEHYVRMDYTGDDIAREDGRKRPGAALYRVTTGGDAGEVLRRDGEADCIQVDLIPFAAMTPVIITHRFFGRSIADLVMDIQRIKTALLRAVLDNAYLANNPRVEVAESGSTETTIDDLLVSRPGGIVRTKVIGSVQWQTVPTIGSHVFPLLEYADATREWRTGVSRAGQGLDANALQNQTATAANQLFNAAQARMKLIARIFAETGIRDLFALLHATIRKHGSQAGTVRLRNEWVQVDPRQWKRRDDMTINVGLGTGSKSEQLVHLQMIIGAQEKGIAAGLVSPKNLYNSATELTKLTGFKNVEQFFTAPGTQPNPQDSTAAPIQPPEDPKVKELQAKAEIEKLQAQADIETQQQKTQAELAMLRERHALEMERLRAEMARDAQKHQQSMMQSVVRGMAQKPRPNGNASVPESGDTGEGPAPEPAGGMDATPLIAELLTALQRMNAPKRIVRDDNGRPIGIEPVITN